MFLAVAPPPELIDMIAKLPTKALRGVRYTKRSQWHITIKFLGKTDTSAAITALAQLETSAANVTLGPTVALLGKRIVMLPAAGLDKLVVDTNCGFTGIGEPQPDRDFNGHITLARLKGAPLRDPSLVSVLGAAISATFSATSLALVKTELLAEAVTYTVVAQKALPN